MLMLIGWGGLLWLTTQTLPRIGGPLWGFFILLQIAVTGTALPLVRYLNVRLTRHNQAYPPSGVIVRQAVWIGLFAVTCAWLQIPRALNWPAAIAIVVVLLIIEVFLRFRERDDA